MQNRTSQFFLFLFFYAIAVVPITGQVFPAHGGYFIVLNEQVTKGSRINLECGKLPGKIYSWPSGSQEFMDSYNAAKTTFPKSASLKDVDLIRALGKFEVMPELGFYWQYEPAMLMAMGQAVFIAEKGKLDKCKINVPTTSQNTEVKTLAEIDQRELSRQVTVQDMTGKNVSIYLRLAFPKNSWVDSARVYKKIAGSKDSVEITPQVSATQLSDRIDLYMRDTSKMLGEFIYTVQPYDQLGLWHKPLPGIKANNYNSVASARITDFFPKQIPGTRKVTMKWKSTLPTRVQGFEIYRSEKTIGPYQKIASLPSKDSTYTDDVNIEGDNFYYYVQLVGMNGPGPKSSPQLVVLSGGSVKKSLKAESWPDGIHLQWTTPDTIGRIKGYYVFRSKKDTTEWIKISELIAPKKLGMSYIDTTSNLDSTTNYAYIIKTENSANDITAFTGVTYVKPIKTRAVISPTALEWRFLEDGTLMLFWEDMRRQDPHIKQYLVATTDSIGSSHQLISKAIVDAKNTAWLQGEKQKAGTWYCVIAEDKWGNRSECSAAVMPKRD